MRANFTFGQVFHNNNSYTDEVYSAMQRQRKRTTTAKPKARKRIAAPPPARVADRLRAPSVAAPPPARSPDPDLTFTYVVVVNRSAVVDAIVPLLSGDRGREQIVKKGFTFWVSHARDGGKFAIVCMKRMDAARLHKLDQSTTKLMFLMVVPRATAVQEAAAIPHICTVLTDPNALMVFLHLNHVTMSQAHTFWKVVDPSHNIPEVYRELPPPPSSVVPSMSDSFDDDDDEEDEEEEDDDGVEVIWNVNNDNNNFSVDLTNPYDQEEADLLRAVAESLNTEQPRASTVAASSSPLPPGFQMVRVHHHPPPVPPPPSPMHASVTHPQIRANFVKKPHHLRAGRSREAVQMMDAAAQELREERQQRQISNAVTIMKTDKRVQHVTKAQIASEDDRDIPAMTILREHNTCTICVDRHITSMVLPCAHLLFCRTCIELWKEKANTCPKCRAKINMIVDPKGAVAARPEYIERTKTAEGARKYREALSQELAELMEEEKSKSGGGGGGDNKRPREEDGEEPDVIDLTNASAPPPSLEKRTKNE